MLPQRVADIAASAWGDAQPADAVTSIAVGDGGPRSADALSGPVTAVGDVEAVAAGQSLFLRPGGSAPRWNPGHLSDALFALARDASRGERTVVVPVGDADLAGDATAVWGESFTHARQALRQLPLEVLVTSSRPLLGLKGMSAAVRDRREKDHALALAAQEQERRWSEIAREVDAALPRPLVGPARLSDVPGSGAAHGLAYCLGAVGARVLPASARLARAAGASDLSADLVIAITGSLTPHTLDEGVTHAASAIAGARGVPCAVLGVELGVGKRDLMAAGVASAHEGQVGADALAEHVRRVARTWSPAR